jgi:hypothetical protein
MANGSPSGIGGPKTYGSETLVGGEKKKEREYSSL